LDLSTPLQFVKGIGPARAQMLAAKGLGTVLDLLYYAPFRYEDRRNVKAVSELAPGERAVVLVRVMTGRLTRTRYRSPQVFEAKLQDGSGANLLARWFHGDRYAEKLVPGTLMAVFGKVELDRVERSRLMIQPEVELLTEIGDEMLHSGRIVPVYEAAGKISSRTFRTLIDRVLKEVQLPPDELPRSIRLRLGLPDLPAALRGIHVPENNCDVRLLNEFRTPAQVRLVFEEFFWLECGLALKKTKVKSVVGISFGMTEDIREKLKAMLPFKPTGAQRRVMQQIVDDMKSSRPMNRLLQGDVGSGKTIVAAQAAVVAIENGWQVAVLAPTEILASQHYSRFRSLLEKLGYRVAYLAGSSNAREKEETKRSIATGEVNVVIGTHALIQQNVAFAKLGLAIIDEQHRFGVRQRLELMKKGEQPDVLVMTATPIPRTLAMTLYGDLDISTIDELPPGRRPIVTRHVNESAVEGVYSFVSQQVQAGRQVYVVYPVVEESETAAVKSAERMYQQLSTEIFRQFSVALLHGRMSSEEKDAVMTRFQSGQIDILVSTTVIEVGVDVPNASIMLIEQAERFGLAQLHQLRGRVGRGPHQSYCILVTGKLSEIAGERIRTIVESNDGFYIAEMDMKLRGPGEFFGTKQSGIPGLHIADLLRDTDIFEMARTEAKNLIENAADRDELRQVVRYIQEHWQRRYALIQVG
jgi:ATP-dependent DNA helicase RecG